MNTRSLFRKRPWIRVLPDEYPPIGYPQHRAVVYSVDGEMLNSVITQADMLREFFPSGHKIMSPIYYPDIFREEIAPVYDEEGNDTGKKTRRTYREVVPRYSFAFQQVIALKQMIHLCGNDVQFELTGSSPTSAENSFFKEFRSGWLSKGMETVFFDFCDSVKTTGDGCVVFYLNDGEVGAVSYSYRNGSTLYPHYNTRGMLTCFARRFYDYDENGKEMREKVEVWDEEYYYLLGRNGKDNKNLIDRIKDIFGIDGYMVEEYRPHGFKGCPVVYYRSEEGPCWSMSQNSIDGYELSFSQMSHNNQAYGEPILVYMGEGDGVDALRDMSGSIKQITAGPDDKVSYLSAQSASDSYMKQLETLYKMIYEQSFTVIPPDLKSGDLPAAALKILYSPAYEKAMHDANDFQRPLNDMVRLFAYGYGVEKERSIDFLGLDMRWWIEPYVHVNSSSVVQDLATSVQNGFCSRQTAAERLETLYTGNAEWERILREQKQEEANQALYE